MNKLKTFENYDNTGDDVPYVNYTEVNKKSPSKEELNEKIKEILSNILKTKQYIKMLRDTTENVFDMIVKKYPKNVNDFTAELYKRDVMLADLVEMLYDQIDNSSAIDDITEIIGYIEQIEQYTSGGNIDNILNQTVNYLEEGEEEDVEEEEDDDEEYIPIMQKPKEEVEDQLKRKQKQFPKDIEQPEPINQKLLDTSDLPKLKDKK